MSKNEPLGKDASPSDYLEIADALFRRVVSELNRQLEADGGCEAGDGVGIAKTTADLRKALQTVFDERKRLEQSSKNIVGATGGAEFNLAQARDEIGRRLALLRNSRRAGGVSE